MLQSNTARVLDRPSAERAGDNAPESGRYWMACEGLECVRDDRTLFSGLSFRIDAGQALQVEGRNGSGKTTLLHILCGLREADGGELRWCDQSVSELGADFFQHIAYVGHLDGVKQDLTPVENLRIAEAFGRPNTGADVDEALDRVGLYGFEDVPARSLSAGQRRRVALARLLVTDAVLWVLDEPYTALDRQGIAITEELLRGHVGNGGMVALTTHHQVRLRDTAVQRLNLSP